ERAPLLHDRRRLPRPRVPKDPGREAGRRRRPRRVAPGLRAAARRGARRRDPAGRADGTGRVRALPDPVVRALQHLSRRDGRERPHGGRPPPNRPHRAGRHDRGLSRGPRNLLPPPATGEEDPAHGPPREAGRGVAGRLPQGVRPLPRHRPRRALRRSPGSLPRRPEPPRPTGHRPQAGGV
ncbi:MAG: hypothetical protein AVDCRST_MAG01-01-3795, partial [uncultured Rubrobacteraceae bacterium]